MEVTRRTILTGIGGAVVVGTLGGTIGVAQAAEPQLGVVVKIGGIPWFNAMEVGIKKAAPEFKTNAWMVGPTQADAAQQVRAIEDLIARKVAVIGIVPNDSAALDPVLGRARAAGIKVLAHEGPSQKEADWDFELTTIEGYGQAHMDLIAKEMGGEGKYIVYVGSLTVPLHNAWADAAIAYQKQKYPKMQMLGDRFGVAESLDESIKTTQDQLRANPDLKGILTFGSQGPIGAARVLDDRGKAKSIAGRWLLAGAGRQVRQVRHDPRRLHLESDDGWRDLRSARFHPSGRQGTDRQYGADRRRQGARLSGQEAHSGAEA